MSEIQEFATGGLGAGVGDTFDFGVPKFTPQNFRVGDKVLDPSNIQGEIVEISVKDGQPVIWVMSKLPGLLCPMKNDFKPEHLRKIVN